MIRREQVRLRKLFQRLALLSLAAPAATAACSAGGSSDTTPDASTGTTTGGRDAGADSTAAGAEGGADSGSCAPDPTAPYLSDASYAQLIDGGEDGPTYACYYFVDLTCAPSTPTSGCNLTLAECAKLCPIDGGFVDCVYWQGAGCEDGSVTAAPGQPARIACGVCSGVGRRPGGLFARRAAPPCAPLLGDWFAEVAYLEAASVVAFERLQSELAAHAAPAPLVRMAGRSARDEVRHARVTGRLARRHGGVPQAPRVRRAAVRSLERVARENAVEGCVRETFGAMVATWQASHARDPQVRASMRRIAVDETRHAALAWAVAAWADSRLDAPARARVARARTAAVRALGRDVGRDVGRTLPPSARALAGLPSAAEARTLLAAMAGLWAGDRPAA